MIPLIITIIFLAAWHGLTPVSGIGKKLMLLFFNISILLYFINLFTLLTLFILLFMIYIFGKLLHPDWSGEKTPLHRFILFSALLLPLFFLGSVKYEWFQKLTGLYTSQQFRYYRINFFEDIGLSYLVFKSIHWTVDCYRGKINRFHTADFLNYFLFFPVFLSGPMDRYGNFTRWLEHKSARAKKALFLSGLYRIFTGSIKSFLLAVLFQKYALDYETVTYTTSPVVKLLTSSLAYSFYIYFNFAGYSDIAIGTAALLGFKVPENFKNPYLATNLSDFWKRWHITLSSIAFEYIFIPFVKTVSERTRLPRLPATIAGYFLVFIVIGAWHGDGINFIWWGLWHGAGLAVYRIWFELVYVDNKRTKFFFNGNRPGKFTNTIAVLITFLYVSLGWILFHYKPDKLAVIAGKLGF